MDTVNCSEEWRDETGHNPVSDLHACGRPRGPHSRHICKCGAEMWEAAA